MHTEEAQENMAQYIPLPERTCKLDEKYETYKNAPEENKQSGEYKGVIEENPYENPNFDSEWMSDEPFKNSEYSKPRMFSMNQVKDIIYLHLTRSEMKRKLNKHETVVEYHDKTIFEQGRAHKKLQGEMKDEFDNVYKGVEDLGSYLEGLRKVYDKKFSDIFRMLTINDKKLNVLKQNDDEFKVFNEMINGKAERLDNRIVSFKKTIDENMEKDKNELQNSLKKLRDHLNDESEKLEHSLVKLKNTCIELIDMNRDTLQSEIRDDLKESKEQVEAVKAKFDEKMSETLDTVHLKITKVKDIWANYFEKYDKVNKSVEDKFKKVNETFSTWHETVVKPHQMSEARVYSVESRLKETEDKFFSSVFHTKEILK